MAGLAFVEIQAGVSRHRFRFLMTAPWTPDCGLQNHFCHLCLPGNQTVDSSVSRVALGFKQVDQYSLDITAANTDTRARGQCREGPGRVLIVASHEIT